MFSRRLKLGILIACLIPIGILGSLFGWGAWNAHRPPAVETTTNKRRDWHEQFLKSRLVAVMPEGNGAVLTGTIFGSPDLQTHVVNAGFQFTFPDDHGLTTYTIIRIERDGIVVGYKSTFDHRSFGRNLVTSDKGELELQWFRSSSARPDRLELRGRALQALDQPAVLREQLDEGGCRQCGKSEGIPSGRMTTWERPVGA
ncbi:hypothetical protein LCGC14_1847800 [marine sediment metagenome]|uniref:Uncharacterized protein n=1 Tax=marine sediment metagenome TaxID=412755 RepID=A0A0F9GB68_9ZZZZ